MEVGLFNQLIWVWIGIAVLVSPMAIKVIAPYGRHTRKCWGMMIDNK